MNKTIRALLISLLTAFGCLVLCISVSHLCCYILGLPLHVASYVGLVASLGLSITALVAVNIVLLIRSTLPKQKQLYGSCALGSLAAACLVVVIFTFCNFSFRCDDHISEPTVSTLFLVFVMLAIVFMVLALLKIKERRPTKTEQFEARIAELEQQVDELKKGE